LGFFEKSKECYNVFYILVAVREDHRSPS